MKCSKTICVLSQNYCAEPISEAENDAMKFGECNIPKIDPFYADAMALVKNYETPLRCKISKRATLDGERLEIFGKGNIQR